MTSDILLIGVDGGATEAKAHAVSCDNLAEPTAFKLESAAISRVYPAGNGFVPVPVGEQLTVRDAAAEHLTDSERKRGQSWVTSAADAIIDLARECDAAQVVVGVGMPGLKTADGRGIAVINNGPRIPNYLEAVESQLANAGLKLAAPIAALGSDADYCGLGEAHAADGLFRGVEHAYYVGCGTGIADALKLRGELVPFDAIKPWMMKSWQIPSSLGPTYEKLVSAKSFNDIYASMQAALGATADQSDSGGFPEQDAANGNPIAQAWLRSAAMILAELIVERLTTLHSGRADNPTRGEGYAGLQREHDCRGIVLERVIVGQRLGIMYANEAYAEVFAKPLEACLAAMIQATGIDALKAAWLSSDNHLQPGKLVASKLRAAPALGAAVAAVLAMQG